MKYKVTRLLFLLGLSVISPLRMSAESLVVSGGAKITFPMGDLRVPVWNGGAMGVVEKNETASPVVHIIGKAGSEGTPVAISIPSASSVHVLGVGHGADGTLAVSGIAYDKAGAGGGFIAWFAQGSSEGKVVRTFPYIAYHIKIAPDGTAWTQGLEMVNGMEHDSSINPRNGVIRHFDRSGAAIASFIPRSSVAALRAGGFTSGYFVAANDRVAWFSRGNRYFEVLFDGSVKEYPGVSDLGRRSVTGLAVTDSGSVFVGVSSPWVTPAEATQPIAESPFFLYELNRDNGTWKPVTSPTGTGRTLYGADGNTLILSASNGGGMKFVTVE